MRKKIVLIGLMMILLVTACGGGEETAVSSPSTADEATATATTIPAVASGTEPTAEPIAEPTAEPTMPPTAEPTAEPTVAPTAVPTVEVADLASCVVGTWDYVNVQEAMQAMITDSMPAEVADQVAITNVNGRLFITFTEDGTASAGAENLVISMAVMGTETDTAVEATGSIAYSVEGDVLTTDLTDYVSTGENSLSGGTVVFDIANMLPAGETAEAVSTFTCEGDSMQVSNPNLPVPLELQRYN